MFVGRRRQQVQRALHAMQKNQLVRVTRVDARDRADAWALTKRGRAHAAVLARFEREWASELRHSYVDVGEVRSMLERFVENLIGRPGGDGWGKALRVPLDVKLDVFGLMEGLPPLDCENDDELPPRRSVSHRKPEMTVEEMEHSLITAPQFRNDCYEVRNKRGTRRVVPRGCT